MLEILDWRALARLFFLFIILCFIIKSYKKRQRLLVFACFLVFLGGLSNNIVAFANGNRMPVITIESVEMVPAFELAYKHIPITKETKLQFLADIFYIGPIISIGDIISFWGAIFLIVCLFIYPVEKRL